jgi:hypothetical protein
MKIGVLSDTHGYLLPQIFTYFKDCDEIWHAGDIGSLEVAEGLEDFKPLRAVHGNIDDATLQLIYPRLQHFVCGGLKVCITHISGTPPAYNAYTQEVISEHKPDLLVGGHTHILRVERDPKGLLYINPGAIGHYGIHPISTLLRFSIIEKKVQGMEVIEVGERRY